MPQKTNLNINPYYDDFDKYNNFYKVLFKPGYPIQARELTTLQSILQNQVESFGSHIFKEGSMVIPGNVNYDNQYYAIKLNADHLGIDVSVYASKLVGKRLRGQTSGIVAVVDRYSTISAAKGITHLTLFVKYLRSGTNNEVEQFTDGEILITEQSFVYGNTSVNAEDTVATLISENATAIGNCVGIGTGVYFIRGTFVDVASDKLVLDPYRNDSSYRVGLTIQEDIVTAKEDSTLYDNAKGFSNYAAPGADRLKITTKLSKKLLTDFEDRTFVELIRIENGEIKKLQAKTQYNLIKDYFAQRTFDESGNYSVNPFGIEVKESLNDRISNDGVYYPSQRTLDRKVVPSDNLMAIKISPGKAYVKGYDIENTETLIKDVEKPRDTASVESSLIPFEFGTLLRANNVSGTPFIGFNNNTNIIELYDRRKASTSSGTGNLIGKARVYSFGLTDAAFSNASTQWDLYLFDIQTYTTLVVNESLSSVTCPVSSYIRGVSSGATGYVAETVSGTTVKLLQTSGTFIAGEQLLINETTEISRSIVSVSVFGIQDVKSVYQDSSSLGLPVDFVADTVLQRTTPTNFSLTNALTITNTGIASCPGKNFAGSGIKENSIIRYQISGLTTETYNRVSSISSDGLLLTLAAVNSVIGVCDGALPSSTQSVTFSVGNPVVRDNGGLYARIPSSNVSSVNLADSTLIVNSQLTSQSTSASGTATLNISSTGISSAFFESFDSERYSIFYSNGTIEDLTSDQFTLSNGGSQVSLTGLTASQSNVTVNATVRKNGIIQKTKNYTRSEKVTINKTRSGVSTSTTGLSTSVYYGTRVEDKEISLNLPDVANVVAIYESLNSSAPVLDSLEFPSGLNLDTASILGEKILGETSGALAQIVTRSSSTKVEIVYLNTHRFVVGEFASFQESNIRSTVQVINNGNYQNVTNEYTLDKGQKEQYYDYSRIVRRNDYYIPTYQLLAIFDYYSVPSNDLGDVYTVGSYSEERFKNDIPSIGIGTMMVRASDTLDFRPSVSRFTSETSSPFAFNSRTFGATGTNPTLVLAPSESSLIGYDYYLPRLDRVVLDKLGNFTVIKGVSALNPALPTNIEDAMDIATIRLPAYLYNVRDAQITFVDNRRYTMRDIGQIDRRVSTLETLTSLSLLELDTRTFQVVDADGLNRFQSGFFVDDFTGTERLNRNLSNINIDAQNNNLIPDRDVFTLSPEIALDPSINPDTADFSSNLRLLDGNVQKTGNLITLKYTERSWINQPLASRVENVNPFNMIDWRGSITLTPASDSWTRTVTVNGGSRRVFGGTTGHYSESSYVETVRISSVPETYIRSRNVRFNAINLRPLTRYYPFFDGSSGIDVVPKLMEITMNSGVFLTGERVIGSVGSTRVFSARIAQPNHKTGAIGIGTTSVAVGLGTTAILAPTSIYTLNPYNTSVSLPTSYSASSTVLNVDVVSLSEQVLGTYSGYVTVGTVLVGQTSGAQATVSNIRLVSDTFGDVAGSFFFRDPLTNPPPTARFNTGTSTFKLTSSSTNATPLPGSLIISSAETTYRTSGILETFRRTNVTVFYDPLAQSFTVDETGAFLTSVDVFFASKDPQERITAQIRTVQLGTPTTTLVSENAEVVLNPSQVGISTNASVPTRITFPAPIYLAPNTEYALVLLAPASNLYEVWIARMGEFTINTSTLPDAASVVVTQQYTGGSLFKSQNGSIWTANQFEDMKFKLYKADFITNTPGVAYFYNPSLVDNDSNIGTLGENPIRTLPRKLKVGITTTTTMNSILQVGRKVSEGSVSSTGPIGYVEQVGGRISVGGVSTARVGTGYSNGTFNNVPLYTITGSGSGATGIVTITNSTVQFVSIANSGNGYVVGDVLGITTSSVARGTGAQVSVTSLNGLDTLYLTNVQGEEFTSGQDLIVYTGNTAVAYANTDIRSSSVISPLYDGRVIQVTQSNHGMHADNNIITLADIDPNTSPTTLNAAIGISSSVISVANTTIFATFEGITTSRGYLKVNNEIMYYTSITAGASPAGTLGITSRGIDGSPTRAHSIGDQVYPYELNGISLTRINTQHNMPSDSTLVSLRDTDRYHLQINRGTRTTGDSQLSFANENSVGGRSVFGSKNIQFNAINPSFTVETPGPNSTITSQIRTVSATSAGGQEPSFIDQGYQPIELNHRNNLSSTRMVASRVNETTRLTNLPRNKSLTVALTMNSGDRNLSPVIKVEDSSIEFIRNRLNRPINDYAFDGRVNLISGDPHNCVYVTNRVDLTQPATSLKVLIGAYRPASVDFRVLYQLFRTDSSEVDQVFELFPGYDNLTDTNGDGFGDNIIDSTRNSGRPDRLIQASQDNEFREYQFSIDNLEQFTGFRIKVVISGTNEAQSPRFRDLRVIALA